jgi:hypothetical protein
MLPLALEAQRFVTRRQFRALFNRKAGKNQPTLLQLHNITEIKRNNGLAIVINEDNIEALLTLVKEIE